MRDETTSPFDSVGANAGVCVADGYGVKIYVRRGHLIVADGIGRARRERRFSRATAGIKRLVLLGREGYVTLEALRWMADLGITFIHIDRNGRILTASASSGLDDPRLRRAQALATGSPTGLQVSKAILRAKLQGQRRVLLGMEAPEAAERVDASLSDLEAAETLEAILLAESEAAAAYWKTWTDVKVSFPRSDAGKVPEHWLTFGQRGSLLTKSGSPRLAANPANAVLNYLYALLEAETRIACLAMGLDPGLGFFHTDQKNRDSLALDVMEAVRPDVDAYVLDLLSSRTFQARDFHETPKGVCRVLPPLSHSLSETSSSWGFRVSRAVEQVAGMLATGRVRDLPTLLTGDKRSAAKDRVRVGRRVLPKASSPKRPPATCRGCGVILAGTGRLFCEQCSRERRAELAEPRRKAAVEALARARAEGRDPAHGGLAARKRGRSISQHNRERAAWKAGHGRNYDEAVFRSEILPKISDLPIHRIVEATGLTKGYCLLIRSGKRAPHPRHWKALRLLAKSEASSQSRAL